MSQPAIIGTDDRLNWYEAPPDLQQLAQRSTVALVRSGEVSPVPGSSAARFQSVFRIDRGLCPGQPYECEEVVPFCSGTLVDGDTVISAGHCFDQAVLDGDLPCDGTAVVFNFRMEAEGRRAEVLHDRDVYYCHEILAGVAPSCPRPRLTTCVDDGDCGPGADCDTSGTTGFCRCNEDAWCGAQGVCDTSGMVNRCESTCVDDVRDDYVVFTIKRERRGTTPSPVSEPHAPVPVDRSAPQHGRPIWAIGHGAGLPVKISDDEIMTVSDNSGFLGGINNPRHISQSIRDMPGFARDFFISHADVLGGNSGGGTFARQGGGHAFVGILVAGLGTSCVMQQIAGTPHGYCREETSRCLFEDLVPPGRSTASFHVSAAYALDGLCADGRVHSLCGNAPATTPVPYVPSPAPSSPGGGRGGCDASGGSPWGAVFVVLVIVGWRRDARGSVASPVHGRSSGLAWRTGVLALVSFVAACSSDGGPSGTPDAGREAPRVDAGAEVEPDDFDARHVHRYVASSILTRARSGDVGVDLDGDGEVDNAFGALSSALADVGVDLNRMIYETMLEGDFVLLGRLGLAEDGAASLRVYRGQPGTPPDPSGEGLYQPTADGAFADLRGRYEPPNVRFRGDTDAARVRFPLSGGDAVELPLVRVRAAGEMPSLRATMNLGGLLAVAEVDGVLTQILAGFQGDPRIMVLDADGDGRVTAAEVRANAMLGPLLEPDVDVDADGTMDHLSFGVRVNWVRGYFEDERRAIVATGPGGAFKNDGMHMCVPDPCGAATTCSECNGDDPAFRACGWCPGTGCIASSQMATCETEWQSRLSSCVECGGFATQTACARGDARCAWSASCGRCVNGAFCSTIPSECTDLRDARSCE
ncbi:MAG: trypsin-like peptidase domain-containing protein [Myxococcales bacterium]|nr:trypsin-like peptidase domain-containing protein [Myxococcales bacterium]